MTAYIFLYNVVGIKCVLSDLKKKTNDEFILIGSDYCLKNLSAENRVFFNKIHSVSRNFHQIDLQEVEAILFNYLESYSAENIRLLTNEESTQLVCAKLREKYHIPGNTTAQILPFVNKIASKNKLHGKVRTPDFIGFNKIDYRNNPDNYLNAVVEQLGFPMFIKPIDLVSSIGTHFIPDVNTLRIVLALIDNEPWEFEIDEFIDGSLYHCDVIVRNNLIEFFMAGKYAGPLAKFSKGSPMGSIPVNDKSLLERLKKFSYDVLINLGMFSSAFHIEVFLEKKSGELIFLEAAARTPGALVPDMYKIIFERHLEELHYAVQINSNNDLNLKKTDMYAGWITFPTIKGMVLNIKNPAISINHTINHFVQSGDKLNQAESLLDSACSMVFWDQSFQKLEENFEFLKQYQPFLLSGL